MQTDHTTMEREPLVATRQQIAFFETFGFMVIRGLFADSIDEITDAFDEVLADPEGHPPWTMVHEGYRGQPRVALGDMAMRHPALAKVPHDQRMVDIGHDVLGPGVEFVQSGGNIFKCEAEWHFDGTTMHTDKRFVKFALYLDPLVKDRNPLRVMPGTHHDSAYGDRVEALCGFGDTTEDNLGVPGEDLPFWAITSEPGDLVVYDFKTQHGSYGSTEPRRVFNLNGCVPG